jgi:hypothetical protein
MPVVIKSTGGGSVSLTAPSTASDLTVTLPATSGGAFLTSPLAAGTTTVPPIDFVAGTNMTTPDTGAMEYDGTKLMFTPIGTQRGIVPGMQYYRLDSGLAGANSTAVQNIIGVGCTLSSSTVYAYEGLFVGTKPSGTTSHSINFGFGGTATLNNIGYFAMADNQNGTLPIVTANSGDIGYINTATLRVLIPSSNAATLIYIMRITGTVSVNAGGTFIPQYSLTAAPGAAYTTVAGSYFSIYPVGASGSNTSVGTWA